MLSAMNCRMRVKIRNIDMLVLVYLAYIIFRWGFQMLAGQSTSVTWIAFTQTLFPILAFFIAKQVTDREAVVIEKVFIICVSISVVLGFIDSKFKFLPSVGAFAYDLYAYIGKGVVALRGYSMAGSALSTGFICALAIGFLVNKKENKIVPLFITLVGCILSYSRGAIAFLAITLSIYFIRYRKKNGKSMKKPVLVFFVIVAMSVLFLIIRNWDIVKESFIFRRFISFGLSASENSNSLRFSFQSNAIKKMFEHPFVGYGFGFSGYQAASARVQELINSESYLITLTLNIGLFGLVLFSWIFIKSVVKAYKSECYSDYKYMAIITGIFAWCVMYILLESDLNGMFYWYCIGRIHSNNGIEESVCAYEKGIYGVNCK